MPSYGRYQVAEPPHRLLSLHLHKGGPLNEVDHEPPLGVLDQQDLLKQGIYCSEFVPGAKDVDALGSCTANATTAALSNLLGQGAFATFVGGHPSDCYADVVRAEKTAIQFYHAATDQTGDPATEWPPTDCGSSGPYIVSELERLGLAGGCTVAHGPENLVSLLQSGGVLVGQPFLNAWEQPDRHGFIDGDGSMASLQEQMQYGVAGGHETYISAIEKVTVLPTGQVDPFKTVLRFRNSWSAAWGDHGSYRAHLSTYVALGAYCDFRQLTPA